jgi:hypothetical protein
MIQSLTSWWELPSAAPIQYARSVVFMVVDHASEPAHERFLPGESADGTMWFFTRTDVDRQLRRKSSSSTVTVLALTVVVFQQVWRHRGVVRSGRLVASESSSRSNGGGGLNFR